MSELRKEKIEDVWRKMVRLDDVLVYKRSEGGVKVKLWYGGCDGKYVFEGKLKYVGYEVDDGKENVDD